MKKRVLIIDDCADIRILFTQQFENLGAEVVTAQDGKTGIATIESAIEEKRPYNLVILDIRMPEMNGIEAAKKIREAGYGGTIAACTTVSTGEGRKQGREAGIDVYLDKMVLNKSVFAALLEKQPG